MEAKTGIASNELLETVIELISPGSGFDASQPIVLSCGGIQLKGRKVPKKLVSWHAEIFFPNVEHGGVRIFRLRGESTKKSLQRILTLEALN